MIYFIFALVALLSVAVMCYIGAYKGVFDFGEKLKIYKPCDGDITPYKGKILALIITVCFAIALAIQISLYKNTSFIYLIM